MKCIQCNEGMAVDGLPTVALKSMGLRFFPDLFLQ
jgi:hypothetical protein